MNRTGRRWVFCANRSSKRRARRCNSLMLIRAIRDQNPPRRLRYRASGRGFVLLPRRWVLERDFGWTTRFRRLTRDYERLATAVVGLHLVAFVSLFLRRAVALLIPSL